MGVNYELTKTSLKVNLDLINNQLRRVENQINKLLKNLLN
jgi:hypothetical protein